jgi:hypothetical protein
MYSTVFGQHVFGEDVGLNPQDMSQLSERHARLRIKS